MLYRYRCERAIRGVRCHYRVSLPRPIENYKYPVKCPSCGNVFTYREKTRDKAIKEEVCHCDGLPFPHRKGSRSSNEKTGLLFCNYRILTEDDHQDLHNQRGE